MGNTKSLLPLTINPFIDILPLEIRDEVVKTYLNPLDRQRFARTCKVFWERYRNVIPFEEGLTIVAEFMPWYDFSSGLLSLRGLSVFLERLDKRKQLEAALPWIVIGLVRGKRYGDFHYVFRTYAHVEKGTEELPEYISGARRAALEAMIKYCNCCDIMSFWSKEIYDFGVLFNRIGIAGKWKLLLSMADHHHSSEHYIDFFLPILMSADPLDWNEIIHSHTSDGFCLYEKLINDNFFPLLVKKLFSFEEQTVFFPIHLPQNWIEFWETLPTPVKHRLGLYILEYRYSHLFHLVAQVKPELYPRYQKEMGRWI